MENSSHLGVEREVECFQKELSLISKGCSARQCVISPDVAPPGISRYMNRNLFSKWLKGILHPHRKKKKSPIVPFDNVLPLFEDAYALLPGLTWHAKSAKVLKVEEITSSQ